MELSLIFLGWFAISFLLTGAPPCLIWLMGHSFVHWAGKCAEDQPAGRQLGFGKDHSLRVRGMVWSRLLPEFHYYATLDRPPDVLVVHAGGNDLGTRSLRELVRD